VLRRGRSFDRYGAEVGWGGGFSNSSAGGSDAACGSGERVSRTLGEDWPADGLSLYGNVHKSLSMH
jgi:hypothetical protein